MRLIRNNRGVSLLEFVLVVVLMSILAAIIVPRFLYDHITRQKVYATAHNIAADLRTAQSWSVRGGLHGGSGQLYWFKLYTVGSATDTFRVFQNGAEAAPMKSVTVSGNDILISGAATDSYYFDTRGAPAPAAGGVITVTDSKNRFQWDVSVIKNTGRIQLVFVK